MTRLVAQRRSERENAAPEDESLGLRRALLRDPRADDQQSPLLRHQLVEHDRQLVHEPLSLPGLDFAARRRETCDAPELGLVREVIEHSGHHRLELIEAAQLLGIIGGQLAQLRHIRQEVARRRVVTYEEGIDCR